MSTLLLFLVSVSGSFTVKSSLLIWCLGKKNPPLWSLKVKNSESKSTWCWNTEFTWFCFSFFHLHFHIKPYCCVFVDMGHPHSCEAMRRAAIGYAPTPPAGCRTRLVTPHSPLAPASPPPPARASTLDSSVCHTHCRDQLTVCTIHFFINWNHRAHAAIKLNTGWKSDYRFFSLSNSIIAWFCFH